MAFNPCISRFRWMAAALVLTAAGLFAANVKQTPDDWVECLMADSRVHLLFEEAQAREPRAVGCFSMKGGVPRWHRPAAGADTDAARQRLALLAKDQPRYREGRYAALVPVAAPQASRAAMASLGARLEEVAAVRLRALGCGQLDETVLGKTSDLDAMFVVAAVGRFVQPGELEVVQTTASAVLDLARAEALTRARAQTNAVCETNWRPAFEAHAAEWAKFAEGHHPWTPGCRVSEDGADLVLRCD